MKSLSNSPRFLLFLQVVSVYCAPATSIYIVKLILPLIDSCRASKCESECMKLPCNPTFSAIPITRSHSSSLRKWGISVEWETRIIIKQDGALVDLTICCHARFPMCAVINGQVAYQRSGALKPKLWVCISCPAPVPALSCGLSIIGEKEKEISECAQLKY